MWMRAKRRSSRAARREVVDGQLRFVLARGIGAAFVTGDVPREAVLEVLGDALAGRGGR